IESRRLLIALPRQPQQVPGGSALRLPAADIAKLRDVVSQPGAAEDANDFLGVGHGEGARTIADDLRPQADELRTEFLQPRVDARRLREDDDQVNMRPPAATDLAPLVNVRLRMRVFDINPRAIG